MAPHDYSKTFTITVSDTSSSISADDFVTTWRVTASQTITIPTTGSGYNYTVNWGDGNSSMNQAGDATHTYTDAGDYEVRISDDFPRIYFNVDIFDGDSNSNSIIAINQWGNRRWTSMEEAFRSATNLAGQASDTPDLSRVTNMAGMFNYAKAFNQDISGWDVSNVTNMESMFSSFPSVFNQDIGRWDVSSVTSQPLKTDLTSKNLFQAAAQRT